MNQLVPIRGAAIPVPALIAAAGERARVRFLEFFAANIRNPHTRRAYYRAAEEFLTWCASDRRAVDRRRPAGACRGVDRSVDARAGRTLGQAAAGGVAPSVRLAGQRPGRAGQPGAHGARAPACRDVRTNAGARSRQKRGRCSTASTPATMPACATAR